MKKQVAHNYTPDELAKLGNTVIYLCKHIDEVNGLSKTRLLKLLYLLEENAVKQYNLPFLDLRFEVWQAGPVARDIYVDLSEEEPSLMVNFVTTHVDQEGHTYVKPQKEFSDDEFSDNELNLLEFIVSKFGSMSAKELVKYTHRPISLWYQLAKEHNLLEGFDKKIINSSSVEIDLSAMLSSDCAKARYNSKREFTESIKHLKQ